MINRCCLLQSKISTAEKIIVNKSPEQTEGAKILVIDDDPVIRMMLVKTLTSSGYIVAEADSGEKGLEKLSTFEPELILLDVIMPGMDGFETCGEIRKVFSYNETPVMMLTGLDDESSVDQAFNIGANDFISKPINWSLLVKRVKYLIRDKKMNMQLVENEARLRQSQRIARIFYWELKPATSMVTMSDSFKELAGLPIEEEIHYSYFISLLHEDERDLIEQKISDILKTGKSYQIDHHLSCKSGKECIFKQHAEAIQGKNGEVIRVIGTLQDITQQRHAELLIEYQHYYDELTELPNKNLFCNKLKDSLKENINESMIAVVFIGIDRFKAINESLGYIVGDIIIKETGDRIKNSLSKRGFVARYGGDTFAVVLKDILNLDYLERTLDEIKTSLAERYSAGDESIYITSSIGITVYPLDENTSDQLTANAEFAMNEAKQSGGADYCYYSPEMNIGAQKKRELEKKIRYALDNDGFKLYYQPQINLRSKNIVGAEALLRLYSSENEIISPVDFIPVAEETGLIIELGYWIIESACKQIRDWINNGIEGVRYGINLSARQFRAPDLVDKLTDSVNRYELPSEVIDLEITESIAMDNMEETLAILHRFKEHDFTISMDDFGTGHSSLSYLQQLPIDILKIDRAFIKDIGSNGENGAIAKTIIDMAHNLNMDVIAEGAEDEEHIKFLVENDCDEVQGFYYSKPLTVEDFSAYVKNFDSCDLQIIV